MTPAGRRTAPTDPALPDAPRILAIKLADFGDALLTTPALAAVRARWPAAILDVLTTPGAAVVYGHTGLVDAVLTLRGDAAAGVAGQPGPAEALAVARRLRGRHYDAVLLFHALVTRRGALKHAALVLATGAPVRAGLVGPAAWRGWFLTHRAVDPGYARAHVVEANLAVAAVLGAAPAGSSLVFTPGPDAEATAAELLADWPAGRPRVAIHPGCGPYSRARRWDPVRFAQVADALATDGAAICLVGTADDDTASVRAAMRSPAIDLTGRTDLPTLAAVLRQVDVVVSNDGGVMHLAAAMDTPVVAVFGPTSTVAWAPWPPHRHRVVALDLPCQPCIYVGHTLGDPRGCPTRDCLAWLDSGAVLAAVRDMLVDRPAQA